MIGTDSTGQPLSRGTRVLVRFEVHGPEHQPFEWTGRVVGASNLPGCIRVQSEYVTWKGPLHLYVVDAERLLTITRLADQRGPIQYHEDRTNGRHIVRPLPVDLPLPERGHWHTDRMGLCTTWHGAASVAARSELWPQDVGR